MEVLESCLDIFEKIAQFVLIFARARCLGLLANRKIVLTVPGSSRIHCKTAFQSKTCNFKNNDNFLLAIEI